MDTRAIAIRTLQLFCFFPLICYLEHFVDLYSLLFSDLCVQIVSFVNERFTNHSTCCVVLRFLLVPSSSFSFAMHSKDEGKLFLLSVWNVWLFISVFVHKNTEKFNSKLLHNSNIDSINNWIQIGHSPKQ